jgi:hypothetical protein
VVRTNPSIFHKASTGVSFPVLLSMLYMRMKSAPRSRTKIKFPVGSTITPCRFAASCLGGIIPFSFMVSLKVKACSGCAGDDNRSLKVEIVDV